MKTQEIGSGCGPNGRIWEHHAKPAGKGEGEKVSNHSMRPRAFSSVRSVIFVEIGQILHSQAPLAFESLFLEALAYRDAVR